MTKALTEEQARVLKQQQIDAREAEALEEIAVLGFRVTTYDAPCYSEGDDLLGIPAGFKPGLAYAVMYDRTGKRKHVAGASAVEALQQAAAWKKWQDGMKDDAAAKFIPSVDNVPTAVPVMQRVGSEVERMSGGPQSARIVSFASGTAELVDSHGDPIGESNHASQFRGANDKEHTSR